MAATINEPADRNDAMWLHSLVVLIGVYLLQHVASFGNGNGNGNGNIGVGNGNGNSGNALGNGNVGDWSGNGGTGFGPGRKGPQDDARTRPRPRGSPRN